MELSEQRKYKMYRGIFGKTVYMEQFGACELRKRVCVCLFVSVCLLNKICLKSVYKLTVNTSIISYVLCAHAL